MSGGARPRTLILALAAAALVAAWTPPTQAQQLQQLQQLQQRPSPAAPRAAPAQPAPVRPLAPPQPLETPPPYERQILRLAEIMGALAWLTEICGGERGDAWRGQMAALLQTEGGTQARRERLAGYYNRGFRGYGAMHRRCTPHARLIISRFLDEGGRIARDVATRYSG
jgi:uncharacterized protein (TIGR02301 family)